MAEILCPSCSKRLRVNPQSKSRRLRCPVCQTEMSLSVSGETVTAKVLSAGPIPEPPPLPPPPVPPPLPFRAAEPAMEEPPPIEEPAPPPPPVLQFSAPPRTTTRNTSSERSRPGKKAEGGHNNLGIWIGGWIGLLIVAILTTCGFLFIGGIPGSSGKTAAQSPKSGQGKQKAAVQPKDISEESPPAIDHNKNATLPVTETLPANTSLPVNASLPANTGPLKSFPPAADFSPPGLTGTDETFTGPLSKPVGPEPPTPTPEKPAPGAPKPEKPGPEKPATEKPEPATEPAKASSTKDKTKTGTKKTDAKKPVAKGPPPATADCEVCRGRGLVPLKKPSSYVWMEGQPVPKGALAVREQYCPHCKPDADNAELAAAEDLRLKTAMDVHLDWEKKTSWQLVRAETRRATLHSQLPPSDTQRVARALEAMNQHIEGLTGSLELTDTTPADCNVIVLFQKSNYLQFVNLLKADPVLGPARQDWSLVGEVAGTWVKDTIFYRYSPEGPPPEHQAVVLVAAYQLRTSTNYKDPPWLNVGYSAYCENTTLKANRVTALEYALPNLQIAPDWSLAVRRLAAAGGLKPWNEMFPKLLRDYKAEDHLTAYAMVAFLIQYKPQKFLDFIEETKGGLGSSEALEKAYGEKVPELQQRWVKALGGR